MFDARRAKALQAGEHLTVEGAPGLRLVASESRRSWVYRYRSPVDQRLRQVTIGQWPATSPAAALAAWERLRNERAGGADPAEARKAKRAAATAAAASAAWTVGAVCAGYLADYRGTVAERTYLELERLFRVELDALQHLPAADLTRAQAFDLLNPMRARPVVARRLRQGLGAAWDHALDAGRLPPETPNWWRLVLRGRLPSKGKTVAGEAIGPVKRALSDAEVGALLRWLPNFSRDVQDALTLYLWTCCRGSEIVAIERDEITREADGTWLTIPVAKLKMQRNPLTVDLRVPLVGRALAVVDRRLEVARGRWLFPSPGRKNGGHIAQKAIGVAVWTHMPHSATRPEWLRPRLPVTGWAPHDLRRTGRTALAQMGCPAEVAEAILGHRMPGVQGVYDRHHYNAERRHWLTALAERWESLGG